MKMFPAFALADTGGGREINSEGFGDGSVGASRGYNLKDRFLSQPRVSVAAAASDRAMAARVFPVAARIAVVKVCRSVVQGVPILVADHRAAVRRRTVEGFRNKAVNALAAWPLVHANRNLSAPRRAYRLGENARLAATTIWYNSADAPEAGNRIFQGAGYRPPFFLFHGHDITTKPAFLEAGGWV